MLEDYIFSLHVSSQSKSGAHGGEHHRMSRLTALFASPRICDQLFGGKGLPAASRLGFFQIYHERFELSGEERDCLNQSCCVH